ncbi:hexose kinase [Glutamicibacter sp.]|uniref:1-phosphofructokinase family hexose kinase n=1 Tax=Glutamicibacter sp. TaxID=1931995 RepID=UPI0028BF3F61|nr:hexose kinase [Glutamicibacter sp.]
MIITLTCNPSLDKTIELDSELAPGTVQRARSTHVQAAGKGVNVTRALHTAQAATLALLPGNPNDPLLRELSTDSVPHRSLPIDAALRTNITLVGPHGITTKINEPGPVLGAETLSQLEQLIVSSILEFNASWLVLAGSLPPGVPSDYYAQLIASLRQQLKDRCPKIAVDTSGAPLRALFAFEPGHVPDLIKPNGHELAELAGSRITEAELEASPQLVAATSGALLERGTGAVLATLGASGAVLTTAEGSWVGTHAPVNVRSTVGAGDSSLAGYLLADTAGLEPAQKLRWAIAYGSAAAALPGSTIPTRDDLRVDAVTVTALEQLQGS